MPISRVLITILLTLLSAGVHAAELDANVTYILRVDGTVVPVEKITRDDYLFVSGVLRGGTKIEVKSCDVADVMYAGRDANYLAGIEKREEGRLMLAAMYFQRAAEALAKQPWAQEYCSFRLSEAMTESGVYGGYQGRNGKNFLPPVIGFRTVLQANPRSRFLPEVLVKIVNCYTEEKDFAMADESLKKATDELKKYRDEGMRVDARFIPIAEKAQARLALAGARLAEQKAAAGKGTLAEALAAYRSAQARGEKLSELYDEAAEGVLRVMVAQKDFSGAQAEAERLIEKFKAVENRRRVLAAAYMALGKCQFARGAEIEARGLKTQAAQNYAEARWSFLHVVVACFENDEDVAGAHYFAGLCYDRLASIESDGAAKARREWQTVVEKFGKSGFREMAEKELKRQ